MSSKEKIYVLMIVILIYALVAFSLLKLYRTGNEITNIPIIDAPVNTGIISEKYDADIRTFIRIDELESQIISLQETLDQQNILLEKHKEYLLESVGFYNGLVMYDSENVTTPSFITAREINIITLNTGLEGTGDAFVRAEELYDINALFLLALCIQESAWGNSYLAENKYNVTSYMAYDESPYMSAKTFTSKDESILVTAKWLRENYLNDDGKYYLGVSISSIGKSYASDPDWSSKIDHIAKTCIKKK